MQRMPDNLTHHHSCHLHGNAPDDTVSGCFLFVALVVDTCVDIYTWLGVRTRRTGHKHIGGRSCRFSHASTRLSSSYVSCMYHSHNHSCHLNRIRRPDASAAPATHSKYSLAVIGKLGIYLIIIPLNNQCSSISTWSRFCRGKIKSESEPGWDGVENRK